MDKKADLCFESSWEVCNKVGGIYTVISSKAQSMIDQYTEENYYLIGPYFPKKAYGIFEEEVCPDNLKDIFESFRKQGIELHFGRWIIKGNPKAVLIDFSNYTKHKDEIKKNLWDWFQIDTLNTDYFDFDEPVIWSFVVGKLLEEISKTLNDKKLVFHCHEWLASTALLHLKHVNARVATVFTTHATTLGRAIATRDRDLYAELDTLNPDEEAKKLGPSVFAKQLLEKQSAQNADAFTTVSEITGIEAEKILGRKPDVLLLNGLDIAKFPSFEEASVKHKILNNRIKDFLMYYFFPYYQFDLDKTLIYFIAGRYEFHDKGIDVFIKALGKLNDKLKEEKSDKTIIAFFWIPGNVKSIRPELLQNKTYFWDIKDSLEDIRAETQNRILYLLTSKKPITNQNLFTPNFLHEIRPKLNRLIRKSVPALSTHELFNENTDPIMQTLIHVGLDNLPDDPVKIVFYPIYLTGADGLLDTSYYESMIGSDLGVFPSYYEPWGYTPLEAAALSVSSLTTDLSGFGRYIQKNEKQGSTYPGVFVLPRFKKSEEEIINSLTEMMSKYTHFSSKERTENKIAALKIAKTADWKSFIKFYIEAENLAIDKLG